MPTCITTPDDQWIWELEGLILSMTEELQNGGHVVEIDSYINDDLKEDKKEDNPDFYRPFDTKYVDDIHVYLMIEAALATA